MSCRAHNPCRMTTTTREDFSYQNSLIATKEPPRFSEKQWETNNKVKIRCSEDQEKLADRVIAQSEQVIDVARHVTEDWKKEVDHRLTERSKEIQFLIDEIKKQKRLACIEEEALKTYLQRTLNGIRTIVEKVIPITEKCIALRETRVGVDLVDDEVHRQLRQELQVEIGCKELLEKTRNETVEQIRRLKANMHLLDNDLLNKETSFQIDQTNLLLTENQIEKHLHEGKSPLDECKASKAQWEHMTIKTIEDIAKELNSAAQLRSYNDILLKQVTEDLHNQIERTGEAFKRRIGEVRHTKQILETVHNQTANQINEVSRNIEKLEKELADKEGYISLCHMRLGNRTHRPGIELVCDEVHACLLQEMKVLGETVMKLKKMIENSKATQRYLLHTQVAQEEEFNIKSNSLKIDDVECMVARNGLDIPSF